MAIWWHKHHTATVLLIVLYHLQPTYSDGEQLLTTRRTSNNKSENMKRQTVTVGRERERPSPSQNVGGANKRGGPDSCPLCDSSVFSYCSDKLLHDACCCLNPFENNLPYQCQYADCSFLHANSCREHHLITACCCDRFLLQL